LLRIADESRLSRNSGANERVEDTMWIAKVSLNRPYTFIVLALLILIAAPVVILRTPTDIFPDINIPVVSIGWTYTGLNSRSRRRTRPEPITSRRRQLSTQARPT
jgi:hypothetical protein